MNKKWKTQYSMYVRRLEHYHHPHLAWRKDISHVGQVRFDAADSSDLGSEITRVGNASL